MTKRSQRKRSDRRAASATHRATSGVATKPVTRTDKPASRKKEQAARKRTMTIVGIAAAAVVVLLLIWAFLWGPFSKQEAETPALSWSEPPAMAIDTTKQYYATIATELGDIKIQLYADKVPNTVNNFVFLARQGYYDNTTFHRVVAGFMAQAGDPTGTGSGGPGYTFADEFSPDLKHDGPGVVSMANRGANTNGSQFFITYSAQEQLDGVHAVFGKVVEGMDVVESLTVRQPADPNPAPGTKILTITIEES